MSLPKVVGLEQEYALKNKRGPELTPFQVSCLLVNAYARHLGLRGPGRRILWDYTYETPFQDGRGELFSKSARLEVLTQEDNLLLNAPLPNGSRFYTDHAHPEYATPECLSAREVVACDKAGEAILLQSAAALRETLPEWEGEFYKNNTDPQGHSYGSHENYLLSAACYQRLLAREPAWAAAVLLPFLVSRQIIAGAGRIDQTGRYQISQRAEFLVTVFGLETMHNRPLLNTRDEPHADPRRFRRLHLILGDANMCEYAAFLKVGTTQLVLSLLEEDRLPAVPLAEPVAALHQVSRRFDQQLALADGRKMTALDLQELYLERVAAQPACYAWHPEAENILAIWHQVLTGLRGLRLSAAMDLENDPGALRRRLDWVLKLWLLQRHRRQKNLSWENPVLRILDLQYHRVDPQAGLFYRLQAQGLTDRLLTEAEIAHYITEPPATTRAYLRGRCLGRFPEELAWINWEAIAFRRGDLCRVIPLPNPLRGTREQVETVINQAQDAFDLVQQLAGS